MKCSPKNKQTNKMSTLYTYCYENPSDIFSMGKQGSKIVMLPLT